MAPAPAARCRRLRIVAGPPIALERHRNCSASGTGVEANARKSIEWVEQLIPDWAGAADLQQVIVELCSLLLHLCAVLRCKAP